MSSEYDDEVGGRRPRSEGGGGVRLGPQPEPDPADSRPGRAPARAGGGEPGDPYEPFLDFEDLDEHDSRDYVRLPRRSGLFRRLVLSAGVLLILALVAVAGGAWWVLRQVDPPGAPGEAVTVTVPEGPTPARSPTCSTRRG